MKILQSYRKPLLIAIALHVILAALFIIKWSHRSYQYHSGHEKAKIVQASVVSSHQLKQAMHEISYREQLHQRKMQQHVAQLRHQARLEKQRQQQAAKLLAKMKQQQLHLKQQRQKQQKALALLKQKQRKLAQMAKQRAARIKKAKQRKRLEALAAKQQALQKQLLAKQLAGDTHQLKQIQTAQMQGIVDKYRALMIATVAQNWNVPTKANKKLVSTFEVTLAPGGMVISVKLVKSSGNQALDQSAQTAIYKSSPLPVPKDPAAFARFRDLILTLSPQTVIHS